MKVFLFILGLILFQLTCLIAQEKIYYQTVRGSILDAGSQSPISGASIIIQGISPKLGTISDEKGEFSIKQVPVGMYNISISLLGYKPAIVSNIIVKSGKEIVLEI